jgi:putative aminopeptidase FrvX
MARSGRASHRRWLRALTDLPTASGSEGAVVTWVKSWAMQHELAVKTDAAGNLMVGPPRRSRRRPVVAVAHMDHPALVIENKTRLTASLRGGVYPEYLDGAAVQIESARGPVRARVTDFDPATQVAVLSAPSREVSTGDIARWYFAPASLGVVDDRLRARACDDLAGVAAALSALHLAVDQGINHLLVLLTRAEEVGFIGAIAACELETLPVGSRVLSIECSRSSADAPVGGGPIVRVGDASIVFSHELTNRVADVAKETSIPHQRKLMAGGTCEATAFTALGYETTGLCLALDNHHNMANIDLVRAGKRRPRLAPEAISLRDFDGLVSLLLATSLELDSARATLPRRLRDLYQAEKHVLGKAQLQT